MEGQKQVVDKLKDANNILVTVQSDPTIDALSACIGLTLLLNELGKHATAVFSGKVPHVLEFLQPEKTLEPTTNSLRDFIISLDKSKADKLRYKVEDKVVKIFITPYKTSITDRDLEFSQGDFNVDVVVAIGVHTQDEIDAAVTAHGRILHDATVIAINVNEGEKLGSINWTDHEASSLSELAASLSDPLGKDKLDNQIATAFLTGIVEQTERFSNNKTTPKTMSIAAKLLTAGANQELVASKLAEPEPEPEPVEEPLPRTRDDEVLDDEQAGQTENAPAKPARKADPGTLEIDHSSDDAFADMLPFTDDAENSQEAEGVQEAPEDEQFIKDEPAVKTALAPEPVEESEEPDPFAEDVRQKPRRIEPLSSSDKPPLEMPPLQMPKPMPVAEPPAARPEPDTHPKSSGPDKTDARPEVSDEAVAALRELQQAHAKKSGGDAAKTAALNAAAEKAAEDYLRSKQINIDDQGHLRLMTPEHRQFLEDGHEVDKAPDANTGEKSAGENDASKFVLSPPSLGGTLTANSRPDDLKPEPLTDPLGMAAEEHPILAHDLPAPVAAEPARSAVAEAASQAPPASSAQANLMAAAEQAISNPTPANPEPLAQTYNPIETNTPSKPAAPQVPVTPASTPLIQPLTGSEVAAADSPDQAPDKPLDMPLPPSLNLPAPNMTPLAGAPKAAPGTPPPVPPPMMPPFTPGQ